MYITFFVSFRANSIYAQIARNVRDFLYGTWVFLYVTGRKVKNFKADFPENEA